ncbi:MAG: MerR family transcriptional regulator, partial [Anaerolineae bacterium]
CGAISVLEASQYLGVSRTVIYRWLRELHMTYPHQKSGRKQYQAYTRRSKVGICRLCEIKLRCAPPGKSGLCGYCVAELARQAQPADARFYDAAYIARQEVAA